MKGKADVSLSLISAFVFLLLLAFNVAMQEAQAESIVSCPQGMKYENDLCYQPCRDGYVESGPTCSKGCRDGYTWDGLTCSTWWYSYAPDTYVRNTGAPSICNTRSFTRFYSGFAGSQ